jgi:histidinol dehydrogenase
MPTLPKIENLAELTPDRKRELTTRGAAAFAGAMAKTREILARLRGDPERELLREYGPLKENLKVSDFLVTEAETAEAFAEAPDDLLRALKKAAENIEKFHQAQLEKPAWFTELSPGLLCGRITRPLASAGVYIPGGRAPYPSTALMNIIPAKTAGVKAIACASPPGPGLKIRPEIIAAAAIAGAGAIYKLGGAWAVGCLAYGLLGFPKVQKIVGPGSSWVTAAKMAVFGEVDVDLPAGPSEGFIIADSGADPRACARDFLAQLEHDPEAAAVFVADSRELAEKTLAEAEAMLPGLQRAEIIASSLSNSAVLVADTIEEAIAFANLYAPEHLQLMARDAFSLLPLIENAGSVFLGPWSPIPAGDYATGPNHVLPTGGAAAAFSGLSTDSFLKKITFQQLTREALRGVAPAAITIAEAEGLECHAEAIKVRLE